MNDLESHVTALALVLRAILQTHPEPEAVRRVLDAWILQGQFDLLSDGHGPMPDAVRNALQVFRTDLDRAP